MTQESTFLLTLLRLGIHRGAEEELTPADIDWQRVLDLAGTQGVVAIAWDGYSRLYESGMVSVDMDKQVKKQWIGRVIQSHEWKYPTYRATIGHLASFYAKHGIKMMVLKGYGLSLNYPTPAHRPCGDVDIWNYGEYKRADKAMLNAIEPGTQVEIHRHPSKDESIVVLRGKVTTYNDDGSVIESVVLCQEEGRYGVDIKKGGWHNLESLALDSVIFECKEGPFVPHELEGVIDR